MPPAAAPQEATPAPAATVASPLRPAGLPRRFFAFWLDSVLIVAALLPLVFWAIGRWGTFNEYGPNLESVPVLKYVIAVSVIAAYLGYFSLFACTLGSTPAKILLNHQVRSKDGARAVFVQSLLRSILLPVDLFVGFPIAVANRSRQRAGDLVAGTIVVRHKYPGVLRLVVWLGGLVVVIAAIWVFLQIKGMIFKSVLSQG